ncbi:LCP family protein [Streptomyces sp. NPDC001922]|uniref:LCP family protein n=1 Tax=Streptomyces sp. NPDC001922 TaxID=3364624 RepID=UPI00369FCA80
MTAPAPPTQPHPRTVPPPRRPRWGVRLAMAGAALLLAGAGAGHAMVTGLDTAIGRVDPFAGLNDRPRGTEGLNFLVVGTDGRERLDPATRRKYHLGGAPCRCTDTIMVVHLSADRDRASIVSIPRDSYVQLPEHTDPATGEQFPAHPGKINAAYAQGGPRLTVRTVEQMTGIHIDHYLEVDFTSFMRTVDALGGVKICAVRPMRDSYTGLDLPVGTRRLNGGEALQYVRSRHVDGAADLGRMRRQQHFMAALVQRVTSGGVLMNPVLLNKVAGTLVGSVRADRGLGADELMDLGRAMRGFSPASSEFVSVPVADAGYRVPGLGSTVRWDTAKATKIFRTLRADRPLAVRHRRGGRGKPVDVAPQRIRVQVENGTDRAGLGTRADTALRKAGFVTSGAPVTAAAPVRRTVIGYDPGWDRSARALATALPGAELRPVYGQGPVMRVTVGPDFRSVQRVRVAGALDDAALTGDHIMCR